MAEAIKVKVSDSREVLNMLDKLDASLDVWSSTMFQVGSTLKKFYSTMPFATQGGVYSRRWPRLKSSYATQKAKSYPGKPILVASGKMSSSFQFKVSSKTVKIDNTDRKFRWHNLGEGNVPQRVMLMLDKKRRDAVAKIANDELIRKVAEL